MALANVKPNPMVEFFGEPISTYTRAQAIEDGMFIDVSSIAREAGIKFPVAMTNTVWSNCVAWSEDDTKRKGIPNDEAGRLWDVVFSVVLAFKHDASTLLRVPLSDGSFSLVDAADGFKVCHTVWHRTNSRYAVCNATRDGEQERAFMHRLIMGAAPGDVVDHVDGNGLNNRRQNLRFVTQAQNAANSGIRTDNVSGVKGVSWDAPTQKWRVRIVINGVAKNLGRFADKAEAISVCRAASVKHFGDYSPFKRSFQTLEFELYRVPREGKGRKPRLVTLKAVCGPGDNAEPVITIMQIYED